MSITSQMGNLRDATLAVDGPQKVTQIRIYPSSALGSWNTSTRLIQYFLPPNRMCIFGRSGVSDVLSSAALGANVRVAYNPAINNRWLTARLQIGSAEVLNCSNLNNGYSRSVVHACTPMEKFQCNGRTETTTMSIGYMGAASPSYQYPGGLLTLLGSVAAAPNAGQVLGENCYLPYYQYSATAAYPTGSTNVPADVCVSNAVNAAQTIRAYTDFADFYGTVLATPFALPTGNGSVLELTQDSVDKSFAAVTIADAGTYAALLTASTVTAAASVGANMTISQNFLKLTVLANDGVENSEMEYKQMLGAGMDINLPYLDQINQSAGAGTSFSTNIVMPTAGRHVRAIVSSLVLSSTNLRDTQCNGSDGISTNLTTARAYVNSIPDTNDTLNLNDTTLAKWNIDNSLRGSMLADPVAYQSHPIYISNLSGIPLQELYRPDNVLCEYGKYFDSPLVYILSGTQDAVNRAVQFYVLSTRKARVTPDGIQMLQ